MICKAPQLLLILLLFSTGVYAQNTIDYNRFQFIEVDQYEVLKSPNRIHFQCNYAQDTILNPQDTTLLRKKRILKVQYFYSGFPKNRQFTSLHKRRIQELSKIAPQLVTNQADIQWELIRQAKVSGQEEAEGLFHGFVIFVTEKGDLSKLPQDIQQKLDTVKTKVALAPAKSEEDITQFLQGQGVRIFNLQVNDTSKLAKPYMYFNEEEGVMGLKGGIMLTTGLALNALGPNDSSRKTFINSKIQASDPDLESLYKTKRKLFDLCIIEFDLEVDADTLSFNYVFASEEYPEFIDYHDIFGFFISGPGIGGAKRMKLTPDAFEAMKANEELPEKVLTAMEKLSTKNFVVKGGFLKFLQQTWGPTDFSKYRPIIEKYAVDIKNIARIPGTNELVSVGTVNHKYNQTLYVPNNIDGDLRLFKAWQYDGFSKVMEAKVKIIPNQTYHLKLAIADQKDARFDSAIFIEGQSIRSKQVVKKVKEELNEKEKE